MINPYTHCLHCVGYTGVLLSQGKFKKTCGRQIKERKHQLEKRLSTMQKIKASREQLGENIHLLEKECADLEQQLKTISSILNGVNAPLPVNTEEEVKPTMQVVNGKDSQRATA